MADSLTLRVLTPSRIVLDTTASSVRIPGVDGSIGVLPRHAPMVAALDAGELLYRHEGKEEHFFVSGGFAQMIDDKLTLLTQEAREPESIDPAAAERALIEASAMPTRTEAEFKQRSRAVARARALTRSVRR